MNDSLISTLVIISSRQWLRKIYENSPAYKNGSILTSIKIGNSFRALRTVIIELASMLARFCGTERPPHGLRCRKFSLSISTERFGQLWCNKRFLLWKLSSVRDLNSPDFQRWCFCDLLLHLFAASIFLFTIERWLVAKLVEFCRLHFRWELTKDFSDDLTDMVLMIWATVEEAK